LTRSWPTPTRWPSTHWSAQTRHDPPPHAAGKSGTRHCIAARAFARHLPALLPIRYSLLTSTCQEPSTTGWTSVPGERIFAGRLARAVHPDCTFSPE
jgi:hypothetical protein